MNGEGILLIIAGVTIFLMFQRWFWVLLFSLLTVASLFTMVASIVTFQILPALGFYVLWLFFGVITSSIIDEY